MTDQYQVVTQKLREEAKVWQQHADDARPIVQAVAGAYLSPSAFFVGDLTTLGAGIANAELEAGQYEEFRIFMATLLLGAIVEFDQIDMTLRTIADEYEKAEAVVELDLDKVFPE
ncbi:hypothetical protein [Actinokineospora iranica]|uniref:Excreted virulence factor EspC, type VII ESX diderm n=1 Tax=Actinokineospora iranica TaxID=1271860 RepID=A0A1G6PZB6_9PSEU|nr:hypothetical protein [Actinokineospora iranica]SDC85530.1 hypothetical protein SAMN05216174_1058 [Actinokineospora iranica]